MICADYSYYKDQFHGVLIPEDEFEYHAARASEYIGWQTFGRITDEYMKKETAAALKIKSCCCALAEAEYRFSQRSDITSEKNGSYSVQLDSSDTKKLAEDTYDIHFRLITPDGKSYRKLSGSLYVHTSAQGVDQ